MEEESAGLVFVGGTSLRLLYNLNRFSEDLDFDLDGIGVKEVEKMVEKVVGNFERENIAVDVYKNKTNRRRLNCWRSCYKRHR